MYEDLCAVFYILLDKIETCKHTVYIKQTQNTMKTLSSL